ncbi:NADPH-dependent F420 reductase [Mucilaginibacter aquaedulcis]|uniref:NADPH-dependent F420 reductase n=1 Tax=Mucilaginibacter aquaedulcis TaxID=1187081 RepID=UPI0025B41FCB|nr:NAD(P)-binding domain-containing protein [Mucilaginibacter aquaedulcis]MDN3550006.1 NAD(P)-binding domain-containing protein [Mucilaginibacter aquaedulcis]
MKIGIIGAGHIGKTLAKKLINAAYPVILSNSRGVESLQPLVKELGTLALAGTNEDAAGSDLVIIAVRWEQIPEVLDKLKKQLAGKIVVDASNRPNKGAPEKPSTAVVAELIPDAMVVKAFNTLFARTLDAEPTVNNGKRVLFLSGDQPFAKESVAKIITQLGFAAIDLGSLKQAAPVTELGTALSGLNLVSYPS